MEHMMEGEQEATAELETAIAPEANDEPVDLEAQREEETASTEEPAGQEAAPEPVEDDFEEFDWNGKPIRAPKGLKDGVMMHADYTRKTQEVAATRKELEQREITLKQQAEANEAEIQLRGELYNLKGQLDQYQEVDWDRWSQEDPIAANDGWRRYQQLRDQAGQKLGTLKQAETTRAEAAKTEFAKQRDATREYAQTKIPGWSPEVDTKITEFALKELAADEGVLRSVATNPQMYRALHLAWLGYQTMQKANAPAPKPVTPPAPLTVVAAKANPPARKSLADMSMDEYVAYRSKQLAR
jgi:hypothetical protein